MREFFATVIARLRRRKFSCGDCERWQSCGLPPDENCVVKLSQIERNPGRWA